MHFLSTYGSFSLGIFCFSFYTPPRDSGGYYVFTLVVRVSALLSLVRPSVCIFPFPDDNLNKFQWIFTKLDMCIDIVEI